MQSSSHRVRRLFLGFGIGICLVQIASAQTDSLALSSGSAPTNGSVSLNLSVTSQAGSAPAGLEWTLNYPASEIVGFTAATGAAASAVGKSVTCSGNTCLISGPNNASIQNGVAAVLTFQLASNASGNLAVQLGNPSAASTVANSIPVTMTGGVITVSSVSVALTPVTVSLGPSQAQQFAATVSNSGNTVTWSLSPAVGTISSTGLYTAPASVSSQQTVTAKATSVGDPTKSASATITLLAGVGVTVTPATASLSSGQTQQLTSGVTGGSGNTAVTWSLSPAVGTISSTGLYTAPASVGSQQTVTAKATSVADPTKSAASTITLLAGVIASSPAYVQSARYIDYGRTNNNTVIVTFSAKNVATGNLIAGYVTWGSTTATLSSVTDSCGNSYAIVPATLKAGAGHSAEGFYAINVAGGSKCRVTATFSANETLKAIIVHEISGASKTTPLDGAVASYTSGGAGTDKLSSGNWTTQTNGDYIFGAMTSPSQNGATITAGSNYILRVFRNLSNTETTSQDQTQAIAGSSTVVSFSPSGLSDALIIGMAFRSGN